MTYNVFGGTLNPTLPLHLVDDSMRFKRPLKHICLTDTAALSDLCLFSCAMYKYSLTYLLSYINRHIPEYLQEAIESISV